MKLVFRGKHEFYSIIMLFSKIAYYFRRLSQALKFNHCSQKTYVSLNFVEKYVRLKGKKKFKGTIKTYRHTLL